MRSDGRWGTGMNLERRTFLVVFVTLVVATGLAFAVAQAVVFRSVQGLEQRSADENVQRAINAFENDIDLLWNHTRDYAASDDTYTFMLDGANDPAYINSKLAGLTPHNNGLNLILLLDRPGAIAYGAAYDLASKESKPVPNAWQDASTLAPFVARTHQNASVAGLVHVDGGVAMVASWPILPTSQRGEAIGTLVWARNVDAAVVAQMHRLTLLDIRVIPWAAADGGASRPDLLALAPSQIAVERLSSGTMLGTARLDDIHGEPALALQVHMGRPIYEQSVQNLAFGLASTILVGGGILVLITMLLDRSVFTPLHRLTRDMEGLSADATGGRVSAMRDDEIGHLAQSFNRLMARLDHNKLDLQRSNQDLRDFAAVVSHDLQPPLSTIALNAAVVRERERDHLGPDAVQRLDRLETTALRMAENIRSILDYSRVSSQDAPFSQVNLNEVMEEVVNDLEERLHATMGRIEYRSLPSLQGNRTQLAQLLLNLMGNALKYHRAGVSPVVKVHAEPYSDKALVGYRIVVEDNGIGFDHAEMEKMVRPYTRLEHRVEGYGLGLATCHKIVERHNGRLSAHSVRDKGSTFMVDLPSVQPTPETFEVHPADLAAQPGKPGSQPPSSAKALGSGAAQSGGHPTNMS